MKQRSKTVRERRSRDQTSELPKERIVSTKEVKLYALHL